MYKYYKLLLKTQYDFASIMHFLLLLPALAACTAGVPVNSTKPGIDARIVGGDTGYITQAPYQVSLHDLHKVFFCSAVIISDEWALTTAHCVTEYCAQHVRAGSKFYKRDGRVHDIIEVFEHDDYNLGTADYDIALLKVKPKFSFSESVRPIALEENEVYLPSSANVSGWGRTTTGGSTSDELLFLKVQIVNNTLCQRPKDVPITSEMVCAGSLTSSKNTCQGDSGGPLVVGEKLVGILSWGDPNCTSSRPDVYTKIFAMRKWIREKSGV